MNRVEQYEPVLIGLCTIPEIAASYGVRMSDFDRGAKSQGAKRMRKMCKECPRIADCYDDAVNFISNELKVHGVFGSYDVQSIDVHIQEEQLGRGVVSAVRAKLAEQQLSNKIVWQAIRHQRDS